MNRAEVEFLAAWRTGWQADTYLTVSEWADKYRFLARETSSEHGKWLTSRAPYLRQPMDDLSARSPVQRLVVMFCSQAGKTEILLNWFGYCLDLNPGPMAFMRPTLEDAEAVFKERVTPLIASTPRLRDKVLENRARDGDNTIRMRRVAGGFLRGIGANSPADLRGRPLGGAGADEIDIMTHDVAGEGDPVALLERRMSSFKHSKIALMSTPTVKDHSRIETEFLKTDQRRYFVPCPHCNPTGDPAGTMDWMYWDRLDYRNNDPSTVALLCTSCGALIEEKEKTWMLERGQWRPTAPGLPGVAGYHLNALYVPAGWKVTWQTLVQEFKDAKGDGALHRVFVNTRLAETFEDRSASGDPDSLWKRREDYAYEVPDGVAVLVAGVDVQLDRLEYQVKGYGVGEESWLIAWGEIAGDTEGREVWDELDEILKQTWTDGNGKKRKIECTAIDSSYRADNVYKFCKVRAARKIYAVKGTPETGKPLVGRPSINNALRVRQYMLCVDTGKETCIARMRIEAVGHGRMHLPMWIDREYVDQLTAEKALWHGKKGKKAKREWVSMRKRNEAFDLEVYSLAALRILFGVQLHRALVLRAARYAVKKDHLVAPDAVTRPEPGQLEQARGPEPEQEPAPPRAAPPMKRSWMGRPRRGWVQGWRR